MRALAPAVPRARSLRGVPALQRRGGRAPARPSNGRAPPQRALFGGAFRGKRVLVTGHTGFKGAWMCLWLARLGAKVHGFSLDPPTIPSLYARAGVRGLLASERIADIREGKELKAFIRRVKPQVVFHLAAQPLVLESYRDPIGTLATNILGTAHVLEAVRGVASVRVVQVITTDKCYDNDGSGRAFKETDALGGKDPYSASKAGAELVARTYRESFLAPNGVSVATARGGNVVGGGDWAANRIVPDLVRSFENGRPALLRNPDATRPWQHVLDLLSGYLWLAACQAHEPGRCASAWNFGPTARRGVPVRVIAQAAVEAWGPGAVAPRLGRVRGPPEAPALALDSSKVRRELGWRPLMDAKMAVHEAVTWHRALSGCSSARDVRDLCEADLARYEAAARQSGAVWA